VVRVIPLPPEQRHDADPDRVHAIVKAAFAQRRKTLGNALRQLMDAQAIESAGIDPKARAETLAPLDFVRLAKVAPAA
jgi:16S rRNA (adenine1518-N6/adenine1519-N6)-dimethyltransferase